MASWLRLPGQLFPKRSLAADLHGHHCAVWTRHFALGGIFHARIRPQEKITLRAIRAESQLKKRAIARYNKRWRSWAQNRIRRTHFALPVTLTSDLSLMNCRYIAACVQKAAALRKHDVGLWHGYSRRVLELKDEFDTEELGFLLWGFGKSSFINPQLYDGLLPVVKERLPEFESHALMSLLWCMRRLHLRDNNLLQGAAQHVLDQVDNLRPSDFIKICNYLAILGLSDRGVCTSLSRVAIHKFEEAFAQEFRVALHPVAVGNLWDDEVVEYLLERFRRIMVTARPNHLMHAYECAVICRVQMPEVWNGLSHQAQRFYVNLSQRWIHSKQRVPSVLQLDVSEHLAALGTPHRNSFRWGPFHIDIGLEELETDERRRCLMVDGPSSFYFGSNQYLPPVKLRHRLLSSLGWDVRHVRWDDWINFEGPDGEDLGKQRFLEELLGHGSTPSNFQDNLLDRPEVSSEGIQEQLSRLKALVYRFESSKAESSEQSVNFDI